MCGKMSRVAGEGHKLAVAPRMVIGEWRLHFHALDLLLAHTHTLEQWDRSWWSPPVSHTHSLVLTSRLHLHGHAVLTQELSLLPRVAACMRRTRSLALVIEAMGPELVVSAGLFIAASDSKHYAPLAPKRIFKHFPFNWTRTDLDRIHGRSRPSLTH